MKVRALSSCPEPLETRIAPAFVTGLVNLADLSGANGSALHGVSVNDVVGNSVSAAGDVNGDGFGDFIIGAQGFSGARGAAHVVFGTSAGFPADATLDATFIDGTKGFAIVGDNAGNSVGRSVSTAGDVNGDGFDDLIVGASAFSEIALAGGAAFVVFGKAGGFAAQVPVSALDGSNGFRLVGGTMGAQVGTAVSGAGDVNGDGFDDVVVGAPGLNSAFIIYGKAGGFSASTTLSELTAAQGVQLNGVASGDNTGYSVSGTGDVNGDGFDDVVIGAPTFGNDGRGAAFVVFGGNALGASIALNTLGGATGFRTEGTQTVDVAGGSVGHAGDVNGDGLADVLIGARRTGGNGATNGPGVTYVIFGNTLPFGPQFTLDIGASFALTGTGDDQAGYSVSGAGDVNGDGIDDLIVGVPQFVAGDKGGAYVIFGRKDIATAPPTYATLDGSNGFKLAGEEAASQAGAAVSGAGDVNGDGFADLLVGAPTSGGFGNYVGQTYLVLGGPSGSFVFPDSIAANLTFATFTDVDGDKVTVKASKGFFKVDGSNFKLLKSSSSAIGVQLVELDLTSGQDATSFADSDITFTVKRAPGGDGKVNVGSIISPVDLGKVTVPGDLGRIAAGDFTNDLSLKSLTVDSLGLFGGRTADTGIGIGSGILGAMGPLKVAGDVRGSFDVRFVGGAAANLASVTVGGSLIGGATENSGSIRTTGTLGPVKIAGDLRGGAGAFAAYLEADGPIASVTIGGSMIGASGFDSAAINAQATLGNVTIGGSQLGGSGKFSGAISARGNMGKVIIKGDQIGGSAAQAGLLYTYGDGASIAGVTIGGDVRSGTVDFASGILALGTLGPVTIGGDVLGTGDVPYLIRGAGPLTGAKSVAIASVKVGGDLDHAFILGGYGSFNAPVNGHAQIGAISVGGDWIASSVTAGLLPQAGATKAIGSFGNGDDAFITLGAATNAASIASVTIKGAARGTFAEGDRFGIVAETIGSVSIGGVKLALKATPKTGDPANDDQGISVGLTPDFVVREVSRTFAAPAPFPPLPLPAAGPRTAQPAVVELAGLDGFNGFKLSGVVDNDYAGTSVSSAGDVNGDGFADVIVGAFRADETGTNRGASYVVFGKAGGFDAALTLSALDGSNGFKLSGVANEDNSGTSVSGAGDVNGDGFDDLIVGARRADETGADRGASYVVFGKAGGFAATLALSALDGSNGFKLSGVVNYDRAGISVSGAGDVNGDGFADLIVGASGADEEGDLRGASYVVFGKAGGFAATLALSELDGSNGFKLSGVANDDYSGISVSGAGDVNGDGFDDVIVGANRAAETGSLRGASYVVFGKAEGFAAALALSSLDGSNGFKLSGAANDDYSGTSVSGAGDVNGDGFADVIVSARRADETGTDRGASYVVFGKAGGFGATLALSALDGSNGFKLSGVADFDYSGFSVSGAGDVNGDGFADLIVGASGVDAADFNHGASYVVFGKAGGFAATLALSALDGSNGFKLSGVAKDDRAGASVSGAGDVNGDGFADVIVSASFADEGGSNRGATYVVFGGPSGEFIDPTFSADGKTAMWTDVDGDLVTLKVSKGTLDAGNFKLLAKSTADARARLLSIYVGTTVGNTSEFDGADITLTAKRAGGGDGKVNLGALYAQNTDLGAVKIGGDLAQMFVGDADDGMALKSLTLDSSGVFGGLTQDTGGGHLIYVAGPTGPVKIAGDVRGTLIQSVPTATAGTGTFASITIGGDLVGGKTNATGTIAAESLGAVKIGGDLVGGRGEQSGFLFANKLTSLTIGGSMFGGSGDYSGAVSINGNLGDVSIGGDQHGGGGFASGSFFINGNIGKVNIKRDQVGGAGLASGLLFASGVGSNIASVTIGGDARGGPAQFSGGILAGGTLGPVVVKGDVIGSAKQAYLIRGAGPLTGATSLAIASVNVGGDFDHALILAGYGDNNAPMNGHAQIGAITVGGDWIASSVTAGLLPFPNATGPVGVFGNGDDKYIAAGPSGVIASIASITIKGRAMGSFETGDFFGIVAEQIGSMKLGGAKIALAPGVANDLSGFAIGSTPDFFVREVARV